MRHEFKVEALKTRLDKYLAEQLTDISRSRIQKDIEAGLVQVNDQVVISPKHVVRRSDAVVYSFQREEKPAPKNIPLKTLYNNHGLLIIDKPAGLAVHPGAGLKGDSLADALLYHFKDIKLVGEEGRSGIVHRLDKDTSGVMLIALTQAMYEHLKDAFAERKIKKEYLALVAGRVEKTHDFIDTPVGKSQSDFRKYTTKDMLQPKQALTEYTVLEYLDECTLIKVKLHTGRTHQIRVHFSSLGHPLMGDALYGGKKAQLPGLSRQFLHAKRIEVQLPDGTWIEAESELADDLREVLTHLNSKTVNQL
jgi:23S rRNA pseudouridine1911/1915/1917 synthase